MQRALFGSTGFEELKLITNQLGGWEEERSCKCAHFTFFIEQCQKKLSTVEKSRQGVYLFQTLLGSQLWALGLAYTMDSPANCFRGLGRGPPDRMCWGAKRGWLLLGEDGWWQPCLWTVEGCGSPPVLLICKAFLRGEGYLDCAAQSPPVQSKCQILIVFFHGVVSPLPNILC